MTEHGDPILAELIALRQTVGLMTTNVAVLTSATDTLRKSVDRMQTDMVPRSEFEGLKATVAGHSAIFGRLTWVVVIAVIAALLGLVLHGGVAT